MSTLSVTYNDPTVGGSGKVSAPENAPPGTEVDCGLGTTGDCSWTVVAGSTLTVFQTPTGGSVFSGWAGDCTGTDVSCTVEMNDDRVVNATWELASAATSDLTVTISGNGTVKGWTVDCTGAGATCTVTMDVDRAVTATFTPAVQLTVNVTGNGNISGGTGAINCGNGANICSA